MSARPALLRGAAGAIGPNAAQIFGVLDSEVPGAAPAHRMPHQVNTIVIDVEFLTDDGQYVS